MSDTPTPIGSDVQVNSDTSYSQLTPVVAALSDGGYVVIWYKAAGPFGSLGLGVYGQRYSAEGTPVGDEFHVNAGTTDTGVTPAVGALKDGGFVVTWSSWGPDGSGLGVYGQRFDQYGAKVGSEFRANSTTEGQQVMSTVTALDDGGFLVTWSSWAYYMENPGQDGSGSGVFGQRYDVSGDPVGGEFQINTTTLGHQFYSDVTLLNDGGFVVTWGSSPTGFGDPGQDGSGGGIYGQRYNADFETIGGEFQINSFTAGEQAFPAVATLADGGFVVAWASPVQDGDGYGIFGQRFDADGLAGGSEFQVNTFSTNDQTYPVVTALDDGGFLVTWSSQGQDGNGWGIYGQRFDSSGAAIGAEFRVNEITAGEQHADASNAGAMLVTLPDGKVVQVWAGLGTEEVFFRLIDVDYNHPPSITSNGGGDTASTTIAENSTLVALLTASDPDIGQGLSWTIAGGEDSALFEIVNSNELRFLSPPDFENLPDAGLTSDYQVTVQVDDGFGGFDAQTLSVGVSNIGGETWVGGNGKQTHVGSGEEDRLTGGNGVDILNGAGGNDHIFGGNGRDILTGGSGDDWLTGGNGADAFVFEPVFGHDVIADFKPGTDTIAIAGGQFVDFADLISNTANDGFGNTVITYDASNTITLQGVNVQQLSAGDFSFA